MCGFVVSTGNGANLSLVRKMTKHLEHRGPDDSGLFQSKNQQVVMGHRRLSVIDLETGSQPMTRENVTIAYNGEIYNYRELQNELTSEGYKFTTTSDTEVLINAYRKWGPACLHRLRGMFSFSLWDESKQILFLARDRMGQKPLFYSAQGKGVSAASEIQALIQNPSISRTVNREALYLYLGLKYIPSPASGFEKIQKLPPAHYMIVEDGSITKIQRYWKPDYSRKVSWNFEEACTRVRESLKEAVQLRLRSDVPLGAFLSGGIDSSITVALMSQLNSEPINTFSIGFNYETFNELPYARQIAERYQTIHHEHYVDPDIEELIPNLVRHYGEPFGDSSAVPTYYVSRETRKNATVALTGDGGDESFGGYNIYRAMWLHHILERSLPSTAIKGIQKLVSLLPHTPNSRSYINKAHRFFGGQDRTAPGQYFSHVGYFSEDQQEKLFKTGDRKRIYKTIHSYLDSKFSEYSSLTSRAEQTMAVQSQSYLPDDLLTKVDIASMMNSLECRSPFLDHKVVELAARLPIHFKLKWRNKKRILKEAFSDLLPEEILYRKKWGFGQPTSNWLRDELNEFVYNVLLDTKGSFFDLFSRPQVKELFELHTRRDRDFGRQLWALLMLRLWWEQFEVQLS